MPAHDVLTDVAAATLDVLSQIADRVSTLESFEQLLIRHGWLTPDSRAYFADVQAAFQAVLALLGDIETLASSGAHPNLPSPIDSQAFWSTFPRDVLQTEFVLY